MTGLSIDRTFWGWVLIGVYFLTGAIYISLKLLKGIRNALDPEDQDDEEIEVESVPASWWHRPLQYSLIILGFRFLILFWPLLLIWQMWPHTSRIINVDTNES